MLACYLVSLISKKRIYLPSQHQKLRQKLNECCNNLIPINLIKNILNEKDLDLIIENLVNDNTFEKSEAETETYEQKKN